MAAKPSLSTLQAVLLLFHGRLISEQVYQPSVVTPPANQDMWAAELLALLYLVVICGPLLYLTERFTGLTTVQYTEKIMGKAVGKLFGLAFAGILLLYCQLQLSLAGIFLESLLLPETPTYVTLLFMAIPCMYLCYKGLESIGRLAEIFVPITATIFALFILLSSSDMNFKVFLPILSDSEFGQLNYGALNLASRFCEILILGMMAPFIRTKVNTFKIFIFTVIPMTIVLILCTMSTQAVLGITLANEVSFPYFSYVRQISVFDFFERIESLNVFTWFCGWFIKFSLYLYLALLALGQIFSIKSPQRLILPVSALLYTLALKTPLVKSVITEYISSYKVLPWLTLAVIFILPTITLAVYYLRRQSLQQHTETQ